MSETMKAMVYLGPGKKEVLERPKPTPQNSKDPRSDKSGI